MQLELSPLPGIGVAAAVAKAVERSGVDLSDAPPAYVSPWRAAGQTEAAGRTPPTPLPPALLSPTPLLPAPLPSAPLPSAPL